jgi:hypothetical protein
MSLAFIAARLRAAGPFWMWAAISAATVFSTTVVLLAELTAILTRYPNRVPTLLREARIIDDPCCDRPLTFDPRQHPLAHIGQHPLVRPSRLPNEMQQRLTLHSRPLRSCHHRDRLDALALAWHHQADAIVTQRSGAIRVADHTHNPLDKRRNSRLIIVRRYELSDGRHTIRRVKRMIPCQVEADRPKIFARR